MKKDVPQLLTSFKEGISLYHYAHTQSPPPLSTALHDLLSVTYSWTAGDVYSTK